MDNRLALYRHIFYVAAAAALVACALMLVVVPQSAQAASSISKAYDRSVAAVKAYDTVDGCTEIPCASYSTNTSGYSVIEVDVSDLALSASQAQQVMDHVYFSTEVFYLDSCGDGKFTSSAQEGRTIVEKLRYTCTYKDAEIPAKKKALASVAKKALSHIQGCTDSAEKVHMIHDWVEENIPYVSDAKKERLGKLGLWYRYKCAAGLIEGYADCSGYAYIMDYLLRKAGFATALVININEVQDIDHCWNLVKVGGSWYHVDVTWDKAWSHSKRPKDAFYKVICHYWMMVSDKVMNNDEHEGWTVWKDGQAVSTPMSRKANAKGNYCATSTKYDKYHEMYTWAKPCAKKMAKGKSLTMGSLRYVVTKKGAAVKIAKASGAATIPAVVWHCGYAYMVTGISAGALKDCKKLTIKTGELTKKSVSKCLVGSKLKIITLKGAAKSKKAAYKKIFASANSGRSVLLKA